MRKKIIIFFMFANSILNLTMAFSEEVSTQGEQEEFETKIRKCQRQIMLFLDD